MPSKKTDWIKHVTRLVALTVAAGFGLTNCSPTDSVPPLTGEDEAVARLYADVLLVQALTTPTAPAEPAQDSVRKTRSKADSLKAVFARHGTTAEAFWAKVDALSTEEKRWRRVQAKAIEGLESRRLWASRNLDSMRIAAQRKMDSLATVRGIEKARADSIAIARNPALKNKPRKLAPGELPPDFQD